jgi:hypothetical protein
MLAMNGIIRYYSTFFDEVIISCKQSDISSIALIFADDPTIRLVSIDNYKTMISKSDIIIDENDCLHLDKSIIDKYSYNALYPV